MIYVNKTEGENLEKFNQKQIDCIIEGILKETTEYMKSLQCSEALKELYIKTTQQQVKEVDFRDTIDSINYSKGITDEYVLDYIRCFMTGFRRAASKAGLQ